MALIVFVFVGVLILEDIMKKMSYYESLLDQRWREKRKTILHRDNHTCKRCQKQGVVLEVHHRLYKNGLMAWEYENKDLISLCNQCHSDITAEIRASYKICVGKINSLTEEATFVFLLEMVEKMDIDHLEALCKIASDFNYEPSKWRIEHPKRFLENKEE